MIKYRAFCSFDSIGAKIRKRWDTDQIFGGVFIIEDTFYNSDSFRTKQPTQALNRGHLSKITSIPNISKINSLSLVLS